AFAALGDDQLGTGPGRSDIEKSLVFCLLELALFLDPFLPFRRLRQSAWVVRRPGFADGEVAADPLFRAVNVDGRIMCAEARGIGQEDHSRLESLGLVQVHDTDGRLTPR